VTLDIAKLWTNPIKHSDVNGDGVVSVVDALLVINALNRTRPIEITDYPTGEETKLAMIDVDGDRRLTINDALLVIVDLIDRPVSPQSPE
jgi:hypothetical protein